MKWVICLFNYLVKGKGHKYKLVWDGCIEFTKQAGGKCGIDGQGKVYECEICGKQILKGYKNDNQ